MRLTNYDRAMGRLIHASTLDQARDAALELNALYDKAQDKLRRQLIIAHLTEQALVDRALAETAQADILRRAIAEAQDVIDHAKTSRERLAYLEQHVISLNERINGAAKEAYMDAYSKGRNEGITEGQKRANDLLKPGAIAFVPQETITTTCVGVLSGGFHKPEPPPNLFTRISAFVRKLLGFLTPSSPK